ncbi:HD-GYP domain-containing protein [Porticoccus sp.]
MAPPTFNPDQNIRLFLAKLLEAGGADSVVDALSFLDTAFVLTRNGQLLAANERFADLIGYSRKELSGIDVTKLVAFKDRAQLQHKLSTNFSSTYRLDLLTKSAEVKHVSITPCVFTSSGTVYRLAGFVDNTDIINLKNAQIHHLHNISRALIRAIEVRDPYTIGHMSRTTLIALEIAAALGLPKATMEAIEMGAGLHDVGKSAIPIEILTKPGKLAAHEWSFITKHPEIGHRMLADIGLDKVSTDIVLLHHECWDGSGYPHGLVGDDIPLEAAVVHAADSLEAIAGVRPYRKAYSFEEAVNIMEEVRQKYHPDVLKTCGELVKSGKFSGKEYNPTPFYEQEIWG